MDIYEVTWKQYIKFMEESGYESKRVIRSLTIFPQLIDQKGYFGHKPITQLTIKDMKAYASFYDKYIPTEIEWEKAARGGLKDMNYPWGNIIQSTDANYNYKGLFNAFDGKTQVLSSSEVGQYKQNGYGLYDMAGNVSEYVTTDWDVDSRQGIDKVIARGGNYRETGYSAQNWYRYYYSIGSGIGTVGFRCVKRIN